MSDDTVIHFSENGSDLMLDPGSTADYRAGKVVAHVQAFAKQRAATLGKDVYVYAYAPGPFGQGDFLFAVSPTGEFNTW